MCMKLPEGGVEPVEMVFISFESDGEMIEVSGTRVIKCEHIEGTLIKRTVQVYCSV